MSLALTRWKRASSAGSVGLFQAGSVSKLCSSAWMRSDDSGWVAVVAVLGIDREAIFLVLQLAEEVEHALAADAAPSKILTRGLVGGGFLARG